MKNILILANNDIGLYKFRKELIEELVKEYKVYISLPYGEFIPDLISLGCEYIETPISRRGTNPITDFKLFLKYIKSIKKVKPFVVLTYTIKPNIYGGLACTLTNIPYISNITGLGSSIENGGFLQKLTLFLYKTAMKKAHCVFFQNKENQDFFTGKKIVKVNNMLIPGSGVNTNYYDLMDYPPDDTIHFLFVSRIMKEKGIDQYMEAAKYIRNKYPNTVFHIVGFCEEEYEDILNELHDQKIIQFHGLQKDVKQFYRTAHCTVHPSYYPEGMSNVLLESSSCGRPVITTNRSGCREIVEDGVTGYIVEQKNSDDLIEKLERFLNLPYNNKAAMGKAARVKVLQEFDRDIVKTLYIEEIRRITE